MAFSETKVNRRRFLRQGATSLCASGVGVGLYAWRVEPHWVEWVDRPLSLAGLAPAWRGKTVVQISDLHVGPTVSESYLRATFEQIALLRPDLILVTGDWMTCDADEQVAATAAIARDLPAIAPVYSVLGNHDYGHNYRNLTVADRLTGALQDEGIHVLRNQHVELEGLHLVGLDDLWARRRQVESHLSELPTHGAAITLCHNPDAVDLPGWGSYRGWILAGHTHGGQCYFPGIGAPVVPIRNQRYTAGEIALAPGRTLYVNRALGYKRRIRFMARPEVTIFRLMSA